MKQANLTLQKGLKVERVKERALAAEVVIVKDQKNVTPIQKLVNFFLKR